MITSNLVMAICFVVVVGIMGAAMVWALLETRQGDAHHKKERLSRHLKSQKRSKTHDRQS